MLLDKFEIFLALLAGLILLVVGILMNFGLPDILLRLLIALISFYIIGLIVKTYLRKKIFFDTEEELDADIDEETVHSDEELAETETVENNAENQPVL
ncbi:MAG: hypothetical protein FWE34_00370 [Defluviitaleaceae bacterium]|nr:hypothetical protein [Defluviitaleaceae bacterium]